MVDKKAIKQINRGEKVAKETMIAMLQNLEGNMQTTARLLVRYGRKDKAEELDGAAKQVAEWRCNIEFERDSDV